MTANPKKRRYTAAHAAERCQAEIVLCDGSAAQCMRSARWDGLCWQHAPCVMRIAFLPPNQAWGVLYGRDLQTAVLIDVDGKRLWESKRDLVSALERMGIRVRVDWVCETAEPAPDGWERVEGGASPNGGVQEV